MIEPATEKPSKKASARQIVKWIKEGLVERNRQDRKSRGPDISRGRFHAREAGGCQLRVYLRRLGFPETITERHGFIDLARRGEFLESIILDALGSSPAELTIRQEKRLKSYRSGDIEVTIAGRLDALLQDGSGIEVKSIGAEEFSELRSAESVRRQRPAHVNQVVLYCWLFDLPRWFLIYVSRDAAKYRCFEIKRDRKREKQLLEELCETEKAIEEKEPPSPKASIGCYFCEYQDYCPVFGGTPASEDLPTSNSGEVRT